MRVIITNIVLLHVSNLQLFSEQSTSSMTLEYRLENQFYFARNKNFGGNISLHQWEVITITSS